MAIAINRKSAMFRLREDILDIAYHTPNETTRLAMDEARDEANLTTVKMDNYDSFLESLDLK